MVEWRARASWRLVAGRVMSPVSLMRTKSLCVKASFVMRYNSRLSYREEEVLALVAKHLNKDEIGDALHISPYTVANHIRHIYEKTGLHSEAELVEYCLYNNL